MRPRNNFRVYGTIIAIWIVLLVVQLVAHTYIDQPSILLFIIDDLSPIPAIVLVTVFVVGLFLERREQRIRKQQLMFIKSFMFRVELRDLYIANFEALKSPPLTFAGIKSATLAELRQMREAADNVEYRSPEAMESVINGYVNAQDVWREFMNIALESRFEAVFQDMLYVMHFISDVKTFRELNPGQPYSDEAAKDEAVMQKAMKVCGDGIRKFLEYAIELKETQPKLFAEVMGDYEALAQIEG